MTTVIIGAGIVGLHIANTLIDKGHEVFVLDMAPYLGEHTSGRNTGVVHAGLYYKPGCFKEQMCIEGNRLTYEWLNKLKVTHNPTGKWVIDVQGQEEDFEPFFEKIKKLPIPEPVIKSADEVKSLEPHLKRTRAIFVPSSGIMDAADYIKAMGAYVESRGVNVILNCKVIGANASELHTTRGEIPFDLAINAAGLFCDDVAKMAGISEYEIQPCRGDYFAFNKSPLNKPVYHLPLKNEHALGFHVTPTTDGRTLIGPNNFFIENKTDYDPHSNEKEFQDSLKCYLPDYPMPLLSPGSAGNRPRLFKNGQALPEFKIIKNENWVHMLGIESPGLTAAPALARYVKNIL